MLPAGASFIVSDISVIVLRAVTFGLGDSLATALLERIKTGTSKVHARQLVRGIFLPVHRGRVGGEFRGRLHA